MAPRFAGDCSGEGDPLGLGVALLRAGPPPVVRAPGPPTRRAPASPQRGRESSPGAGGAQAGRGCPLSRWAASDALVSSEPYFKTSCKNELFLCSLLNFCVYFTGSWDYFFFFF